MFRGVPAISRSDWPFADNPQLIGQYCNIEPFDLITNLVMDRSPRFGSEDSNYSRTFNMSVAFARVINLATVINLLTHYTKGTLLHLLS